MRKARILLALGTWVAILPYLGFTYAWKNILFTITGLGLIYFSYVLYRNYKIKENQKRTFDNFRENDYFNKNQNLNEVEKAEEPVDSGDYSAR